ncbi:hypothetical protein [Pseudomonas mandelii]|uniref:hypothetical protein n=1 Tax=Pseudomonas mandelii TaxID=75612 RepID=UPI000369F466|nr:hypothetical protein [Pseudomonas mandelii]
MSNGKITIGRPIEPLTRFTGRRLLKAINTTQYLDPDAIFVECILATVEMAGSGWCMHPDPEVLDNYQCLECSYSFSVNR